jgi:hypothetical protein
LSSGGHRNRRRALERSYTTKLCEIRFFDDDEAAHRERGGNEIVEELRPS